MKKRSLFAAVAMLLVSAIMLTSVTYAWFASSTTASAAPFSAVVENADGSVLLVPDQNRRIRANCTSDAQYNTAIAPTTSLTSANFNPMLSKLQPVSISTNGNTLTATKVLYDSLTFTEGSASENISYTLDSNDQITAQSEGDYIHYGFKVRYKGVTSSSQYVRVKPTLTSVENSNCDFGYVLVRVKPYDSASGATATSYTDFWYRNDGSNSYVPVLTMASQSIADDKTDTNKKVDIIDATDEPASGVLAASAITGFKTSGQWLSADGTNEFQVIPAGLSTNNTYEASIEVYIWAEGNDPDCHGTVSGDQVGVGFNVELYTAPSNGG